MNSEDSVCLTYTLSFVLLGAYERNKVCLCVMKSKQFEILEGLFEEEGTLFGETIFTTSIFVLT